MRRLPSFLNCRTDLFLVQLGINDASRHARRRRHAISHRHSDEYVTAFAQMYVELAAKNNATLVPYLLEGVGGDPSLSLDDRIHPNAAGQKILATTMWKALEPLARQTRNR